MSTGTKRPRGLLTLLLAVFLLLALNAEVAAYANTVAGSRHDFRSPANGGPNSRYSSLAGLAGKSPCASCHTAHKALGDSLQAADFGLRLNHRMQAASLKCLACHDGVIETPDGNDTLSASGLLARHSHRVEFDYPPAWMHGLFFRPVAHDQLNRMSVPDTRPESLPLDYDPVTRRAKATCLTCHDQHNPGKDGLFLRGESRRRLCLKCHTGEMAMSAGLS